jgi:hypothetical protein
MPTILSTRRLKVQNENRKGKNRKKIKINEKKKYPTYLHVAVCMFRRKKTCNENENKFCMFHASCDSACTSFGGIPVQNLSHWIPHARK